MKSKQFGPSIYHVTDKNIYDAFCHKRIKHSDTLDYMSQRGIFMSRLSAKPELMEYASRLPHDYFDKQFLAELLETQSRREKTTSSIVEAMATTVDLNDAYKSMASELNCDDERVSFSCEGNKTTITVTHTIVDHSKTELKQKEHKTFAIEIINNGSSLDIRRPSNQKSKEISDRFVEKLGKLKSVDLEEKVVTLEAFTDPEARTYFFKELIKSLDGYAFDDVRIVGVHHGVDAEEDDEEEDASLSSNLVGHIKKAVLDGDGVLNSEVFKQLHDSGFFISRVVWSVAPPGVGNDKYELEALFGNQETCTDFKYIVCGVYALLDDGQHSIKRRLPSTIEKEVLITKLEKASRRAMRSVIDKYGA